MAFPKTVSFFLLLLVAGVLADPLHDLFMCSDPTDKANAISCNPSTYQWNLDALNPQFPPDVSFECQETIDILYRSKVDDPPVAQETLLANLAQWERTLEDTVVDSLKPCVLWAMTYGPLQPWSLQEMDISRFQLRDDESPESSTVRVSFDPIVITLVWEGKLPEPLSLDRSELEDLTSLHMLLAVQAQIGDFVESLDLDVQPGLPDYQTNTLPLTLTGSILFDDPKHSMGASTLQKVLLQSGFGTTNAMELYLFRLHVAKDPTLQDVDIVFAGKEAYQVPLPPTLEVKPEVEEEGVMSALLIAIISAVGAAILAVCCFAYCLICRSKTSDKAAETLEEHSLDEKGLPAVRTVPTNEDYDIEYGNQADESVSDMDTFPPPSTHVPSDGDSMSIVDVEEETPPPETNVFQKEDDDDDSVVSDANTSLYSYIPDDTSVTGSMLNAKKSVLWSVPSQEGKMLGPTSDNESEDSNSLFYGTDEDKALPPPVKSSEDGDQFEELWTDEPPSDDADSVIGVLSAVRSSRTPLPDPPASEEPTTTEHSPEEVPKSMVDRVPETNEEALSLVLPTTLESKEAPTCDETSVASSGSKRDSASVASSGSVTSTDSSKFRSLLGQSDTNDAALVFGTKEEESSQLKSLLTRTASSDEDEDDNALLFSNTKPEEEKKDEDDDDHQPSYLPAMLSTPRALSPKNDVSDDVSVFSALSDAPSVDESITSKMGWF